MPQHADLFGWGTRIERERRTRVRLCVAAYAYEVMDQPMITDAEYDRLAYSSDPTIQTGHLDDWWRVNFTPHTGQWILSHPELIQLRDLYKRVVTQRETRDENR